ncbi:hypothetical protein VNO80_09336 [Phaseolus coccineus]|uniref:Uncharacterized protein n=1 Tax=Phaseolus coccineus TaxID=3886 RepID=A0AAN9NBA4_PHACN
MRYSMHTNWHIQMINIPNFPSTVTARDSISVRIFSFFKRGLDITAWVSIETIPNHLRKKKKKPKNLGEVGFRGVREEHFLRLGC